MISAPALYAVRPSYRNALPENIGRIGDAFRTKDAGLIWEIDLGDIKFLGYFACMQATGSASKEDGIESSR